MLSVGSESFFSLPPECQESAGKMVHPCTYTCAFVFDRRQTFCESAPYSDELVNLQLHGDGDDRQTEC